MLYHPCHLRVGAALGPQDIRDTVQRNSCTRNTIVQVVRTICEEYRKFKRPFPPPASPP
jgi:hypothetical protein